MPAIGKKIYPQVKAQEKPLEELTWPIGRPILQILKALNYKDTIKKKTVINVTDI